MCTEMNRNASIRNIFISGTGTSLVSPLHPGYCASQTKFLLVLASFLAILLLGVMGAEAQLYYSVRAGATGVNNGSDWTNAFTQLPSTLQRGATYYVADGTYSSYTFGGAVSGTSVITIKKATAPDHGTDTGWDSSYGDGQAVWNGPLIFNTGYYVFDGVTRNENNWFDGTSYGFKIYHNNQDQQITMGHLGTAFSNVEIRYTYLQALNTALPGTTIRRYTLDMDTYGGSGTFTKIAVRKCFFQYGNVHIFTHDNDGMIVEYSAFDANDSNNANHGECMSAYYSNDRFIIRYNKFRAITGTAVIAFTHADSSYTDGFEIYGNVIWNHNVGDGVFGFDNANYPFSNTKIYNNTIVDKAGGYNSGIAIRRGTNNVAYNNLWVNCGGSFWIGDGITHDYNAFDSSVGSQGEPHEQTNITTSIFKNYAGKDFLLSKHTTAGKNLGSPYDVDMLGNTRQNWDRGANEFVAPIKPSPPTNFRIISP